MFTYRKFIDNLAKPLICDANTEESVAAPDASCSSCRRHKRHKRLKGKTLSNSYVDICRLSYSTLVCSKESSTYTGHRAWPQYVVHTVTRIYLWISDGGHHGQHSQIGEARQSDWHRGGRVRGRRQCRKKWGPKLYSWGGSMALNSSLLLCFLMFQKFPKC